MTDTSTVVATDPLTYVRRSTCQLHLQPLNMQADTADARERVVRPGQIVDCPDCGRTWHTVQKIAWGGVVLVEWQCYSPPGQPDPDEVLDARLTTLEGTVGAQAATLAAANSAIAALTNRVAALEARTVTFRRALPKATVALAIGARDVTVTWTTPFPDTNYTIEALPLATLLGTPTCTVKSKTAAGAVITLNTTVAIAINTPVLDVTAWRLGAP